MQEKKLSFTGHLEELRKRLAVCIVAVGIGFVVSLFYSKEIYVLLSRPLYLAFKYLKLKDSAIHFANPIEPFFTYLKLSLVTGFFIASPVVLYQLWKFVAPGLYPREKKYAAPFVLVSSIVFIGGAAFGYFVVFPWGFKFFLSFADPASSLSEFNIPSLKIKPTLMMGQYLSFTTKLLLAFGIVFELPVFLFFLCLADVINYQHLWRFGRYAILIFVIIGAMLTPPDVITQIMMALPLCILYLLSLFCAYLIHLSRKGKGERESKVDL
jgi:sec-independent protein translocase protein TatC